MISYRDTRGNVTDPQPFSQVIVEGIAPGGGLYVPETLPHLSLEEISNLKDLSYAQRAAVIYRAFQTDFDDETVAHLLDESYGSQFDTPEICPLVRVEDGMYALELFHGPTSAFKDMALQCLPRFFSHSLNELHDKGVDTSDRLVLVATSGDTGSAALYGFSNLDHVSVMALYPHHGVSDIQHLQMATMDATNTHVCAARGNFDDCQSSVKELFADASFADHLLKEHNTKLTSANSINWGRLMPQIVYYVSAYAELVKAGEIDLGDLVDVCVPTGNFGNILAAYYAKQLGTPLDMLYCASNENNVLTDFINTGVYDISSRDFTLTPSPSMDILISSNLERQLFEVTGRDHARINEWMKQLSTSRKYTVDKETFANIRAQFAADFCNNEDCLKRIHATYQDHGYLMDPHTAVAYEVASRLKGDKPVIIASTAHWGKFGPDVYRALNNMDPSTPLPEEIAHLSGCELNRFIVDSLMASQSVSIPQGLDTLDRKPIVFDNVIDADASAIGRAVTEYLSE